MDFTTTCDRCSERQFGSIIAGTEMSSLVAPRDKNDCQVSVEKGRLAFLLVRWRGQLISDETEGDADGIELDRRVLDYYLDQYNKLLSSAPP